MRMLQRRAGCFAVIFEHQDVLEAAVLLEVENAVAEGPEQVFHALDRHGGQALHVVRRLDHDFVRADSVHPVKHAVSLAVEVALDAQCGKFVRHHAQVPSGGGAVSIFRGTVGQNLRRRLALIAGTKRTESPALDIDALAGKISRPTGTVGGDDDPASGNRIFAKFRHTAILQPCALGCFFLKSRSAAFFLKSRSLFLYPEAQRGIHIVTKLSEAASQPRCFSWLYVSLAALRDFRKSRAAGLQKEAPLQDYRKKLPERESILEQLNVGFLIGLKIDADDVKPERDIFTHLAQELAGYMAEVALLFQVHGSFGRFYLARGARLDFNEAERAAVPTHKIKLAAAARTAVVARHNHIAHTPQIEVGFAFTPPSGVEMLRAGWFCGQEFGSAIERENSEACQSAGHRIRREWSRMNTNVNRMNPDSRIFASFAAS